MDTSLNIINSKRNYIWGVFNTSTGNLEAVGTTRDQARQARRNFEGRNFTVRKATVSVPTSTAD